MVSITVVKVRTVVLATVIFTTVSSRTLFLLVCPWQVMG